MEERGTANNFVCDGEAITNEIIRTRGAYQIYLCKKRSKLTLFFKK
jgi:hypothetical protein